MRRLSTAILAIGIAIVFLLYMVTYTVNYNEIAIITTFDKATDPDPAAGADKDSGSVIREPGLKWKAPWPFQRIQKYPTQLQVLQDSAEQLALSDNNTIVINLSLTWRIDDPLAFFKSLGTIDEAEDKLLGYLRDLRSIISNNYRFEDLVNEDPSKVKLAQIESEIATELSKQLNAIQPSYGIEVAEVTIGKMLYASSTAGSVNERMTATQVRKAQDIRSQGESQARAIISEAESISKRLKDFANTVAAEIEVIGIRESNDFLSRYSEKGASEDLAIYLRQLESLEKILANRTTFVLDARTFSPLDVLVYGHGGPGNLSRLNKEAEPEIEPTSLPPAVLNSEQLNRALMERVRVMEARILELEAELQSRQAQPAPLIKTALDSDAEARP